MAKNYNEKRENNPDQIIKKFGNNVFLEVIQPNADFERFTINICSLNADNTMKSRISTYVDTDKFMVLCHRIACGRFGQGIERAKAFAKQSNNFPEAIWKVQGGNAEAKTAWMLSIHPATKTGDCIIKAQKGAGKVMDNGLIQLIYNKNNEQNMISLTHEDLEAIAVMCIMRFQAYITERQLDGAFNRKSYNPGPQETLPQEQSVNNNTEVTSSTYPVYDYDEPNEFAGVSAVDYSGYY